jgi:hypothetical protein
MSHTKLTLVVLALGSTSLVGCAIAAIAKGGQPMTAFPAPINGEVDAILPDAKLAMESDFPGTKVLRVESLQRTFDPISNEFHEPVGRMAVLNFGFELGGKCYIQPRKMSQDITPTGYAGVKLYDVPWAEGIFGKGNQGSDYYKFENLKGLGKAWPLECSKVSENGPRFIFCPNTVGGQLCEQ